jgi:hypothetical protein
MPHATLILRNMNKKIWILLPLSFFIAFSVFGQEAEKKKSSGESPDSTIILGKGRIVYKNRIYRQNASYLTMGYGAGYGFESKQVEQNMSLSYHQFIKKIGLQIGYHSSSDTKIWWRSYQKMNDLFLGVGARAEGTRYNLSVFGGPSWSYGSYWIVRDSSYHSFRNIGFHAEAQATYKIAYDIGVGLSVYTSLNRDYSVVGAEVHLFFSTAYIRNY